MSTCLVLGGVRSGKSRFALQRHAAEARLLFVATAQAGDPDMAARIARHQAERPAGWTTVEAPFDLVGCLAALPRTGVPVVVDCLTLWVANRQLRGDPDAAIQADARRLATLLREDARTVTIVSNEVGAGVHPETALGLRFRDLLGHVNQEVAAACDEVVLMVAGLPLTLKARSPRVEAHAPEPS